MRPTLVLAFLLLAAFFFGAADPAVAQKQKRVALVIGNNAYTHTTPLENPRNDALAMEKVLRRLGFEVILGTDLDRQRFFDKLDEFGDASYGADVTLFFYAGHGLQVDEDNYLVPTDAKLKKKLHLRSRAVKLGTVMENMQGRHNLVFLDACRDNPLAIELARSMGLTRTAATATRGLASVQSPVQSSGGTLIAYATQPGNTADDRWGGGGSNSPFTAGLLEHFETPGQSVSNMLSKVIGFVRTATNDRQRPWVNSSMSDVLILVPGGGGDREREAAMAYKHARTKDTVAAYQDVIDRFPRTEGARLAQEQIGRLESIAAYKRARTRDTVAAYRDVINRFPDTEGARLAQEQIGKLDSIAAYRRARTKNTVPAYKGVVNRFPGTEGARLAQGQIDSIAVYRSARTRDTVAAYQDVTNRFPDTEGARLAQEQIGKLDSIAAYKRARTKNTVPAYKGVVNRFPGTEGAKLAQEQIDRLGETKKPNYRPGMRIVDCTGCPRLVVAPAGDYTMGQLPSEEVQGGRFESELPEHAVTIAEMFAVGIHEVTFSQWDACHSAGGCSHRPGDNGWGRGDLPVIDVSWHDAKEYVSWLSRKTGKRYRLLSESEWEYVARAGTPTGPFHTGSTISTTQANYDGRDTGGKYRGRTVEVDELASNAFGLYHVHGNVWEWVEDCWHPDYHGAPNDGRAWTFGGICERRVVRGGSWRKNHLYARFSYRVGADARSRFNSIGFRVARTLGR